MTELTMDTEIRCPKCGGIATLEDYDVGLADEGNVFCNVPDCRNEIAIAPNVVPAAVADGQMELF